MSTLHLDANARARLTSSIAPIELTWVAPAELGATLSGAQAAFVRSDVDEVLLARPELEWVHSDHASLEGSARPEVFDRGLIVTGSQGRAASALAEHAMLFMLGLAFDVYGSHRAQRRRRFSLRDGELLRPLVGRTVGIVGLGHTGRALATRAKAFEMHVIAYRRKDLPVPPGVDEVLSRDRGSDLLELLPRVDFVVLAASLNDESHGLIGAKELGSMKRSAFLINVARGALVDENALVGALARGQIAGAGLDSFLKEPLDPDSPLWSAPRTMITPHFTPRVDDQDERVVDILLENVRRYSAGEPLSNMLARDDVYTHLLKRKRTRRKRVNDDGPIQSTLKKLGRLFSGPT